MVLRHMALALAVLSFSFGSAQAGARHSARHQYHARTHRAHQHRVRHERSASEPRESFASFTAPHQTLWWDRSGSAFGSARTVPKYHARRSERARGASFSDPRPRAWCGWYMRRLLGVADRSLNLARNWAHWGHGGAPGVGAVVVWPHHVGKIVGRAGDGRWIIQSGNDGHAVRTRARSVSGAIAFRWG